MSKKIYKTIPVIAAVNEVAWYGQEKDKLNDLSVKARWNLKKNIKELGKIADQYNEFRGELDTQLREKYSNDEMSVETEIDQPDGTKQPGRRVKDEYLEQYQKDIAEMNEKINELLRDTEEVELYIIDMDAEVEKMKDDAELSDAAMDMLSLFEDIEETISEESESETGGE
jgi:hypothetical protein